MELVLVAALAEKNRVIGRGEDLPWHIPADLKHFKKLTLDRPLVMGRTTFESIVHQFGGPLPRRRHLVLTRHGPFADYPDIATYASIPDALAAVADEPVVCIGGGANVYSQMLERADRLELTLVEGDYDGDAFFPAYEHLIGPVFEQTAEEQHDGFRFVTYERRA